MFLIKVCRVFKKYNINYAVVGGHAVNLQGFDVKVLGKRELIEMKKRSGRKQDLIDIEALELL
jgi:hypothetical protein